MNKFSLKRILYTENKRIDLINEHTLYVSKDTLEVQYLCNNLPIIRQFLLSFNKVYHILDSDFVTEVMRKYKNWYDMDIYVFLSFTLKDNLILNNLNYTLSLNSKGINDKQYIDLFSVTYNLGRENVLKMYKCFVEGANKYNLGIKNVAYIKVHRLTSQTDYVRIVSFDKFINLVRRDK